MLALFPTRVPCVNAFGAFAIMLDMLQLQVVVYQFAFFGTSQPSMPSETMCVQPLCF